MYQPVLSGGCGFVFGNFPIWSFWDPGDPGLAVEDGAFPGGWTTAFGSRGASPLALRAVLPFPPVAGAPAGHSTTRS